MTLFGAMEYFSEQRNILNSNKSETDALNTIPLQFRGVKLCFYPFLNLENSLVNLFLRSDPQEKVIFFDAKLAVHKVG